MNVYDHIDANRRRTFLILALFPLTLLALTALVCFVLAEAAELPQGSEVALGLTMKVFPWLTVAVFVWIGVSYGVGDRIILDSAAARRIEPGDDPRLFSLVENVAIMAGLPMPELYLIDDESLNAFATGRSPETASVALTKGIVAKLKPNELEAVVAHELGHVGNRDTRLMIIVVTGIAFFMFAAEICFRIALTAPSRRFSGSRSKDDGSLRAICLAVAAICWLFGLFAAPLIRMALSRNREFLADATAARITHNPDALADALQAISADPRVEVLDSRPLVGALCVANPLSRGGLTAALYATHPPIEARIARLRGMARSL
jgi:heat shock protein HtpX